MIIIDKVLLSDEIIEEQFLCDLSKCKGACCEDGDSGAPLTKTEKEHIKNDFNKIKHLLTIEGINEIKKQGKFVYDQDFGWVTPTINKGICVYAKKNEQGVIKCIFEESYNQGIINWKKPISCHLFPIKISQSNEDKKIEYVNYEPRKPLCNAGCSLGKKQKLPVYRFLKESLILKFGEAFYETLDAIANHKSTK